MSELQKGDSVEFDGFVWTVDTLSEGRGTADLRRVFTAEGATGYVGQAFEIVAQSLLSKIEPESECYSTLAMSRSGMNSVEICKSLGWTEGTQIVGDEGYGPTVWEITALRPNGNMLARTISHNGKAIQNDEEHFCTLSCRDWSLYSPAPAVQPTDDQLVRLLHAVKEENEAGEISDDVAARLLFSLVDDGADSDLIAMQNWDAEKPRGKSLGIVDGVEYRICDPKPGETHETWCDKYEPVEPQSEKTVREKLQDAIKGSIATSPQLTYLLGVPESDCVDWIAEHIELAFREHFDSKLKQREHLVVAFGQSMRTWRDVEAFLNAENDLLFGDNQ